MTAKYCSGWVLEGLKGHWTTERCLNFVQADLVFLQEGIFKKFFGFMEVEFVQCGFSDDFLDFSSFGDIDA